MCAYDPSLRLTRWFELLAEAMEGSEENDEDDDDEDDELDGVARPDNVRSH